MYNKWIGIGRLTVDPELKQTPNGVAVTSFSIAVDRPYSKGKERQTDFISIVAWRNTAEFICRYFEKGKPILIDGSIQVRSYVDKQGNNRRAWEIVANDARFVVGKNDGDGQSGGVQGNVGGAGVDVSGSDDFAELDDDGDLPFPVRPERSGR